MKYNNRYILTFQNVSCYGLLDVNTVLPPIPTGQYVQLVYFPGLQYVACRAEESSQNMITVTVYEARPQSLVYHSHEYHITDIKVYKITYSKKCQVLNNTLFSLLSVPAMN